MFLPLYFKTDLLPCLVIGGGNVAAHKVELLLAAGCSLTVISPEINARIRHAVDRGLTQWHSRKYADGDCAGFQLIVAATADEETNRGVSSEARRRGIPVNVVDLPELCTVIFGAVWRDGPLTISVSTGGEAPFMAGAIRDHFSELAYGMGEWVEAAGRFRAIVRSEVRDSAERERLYRLFIGRSRGGPPTSIPQGRELGEWLQWLYRPGAE